MDQSFNPSDVFCCNHLCDAPCNSRLNHLKQTAPCSAVYCQSVSELDPSELEDDEEDVSSFSGFTSENGKPANPVKLNDL